MKRNLVLLLLVAAFFCTNHIFAASEEYRPLLKNGKSWECYYTNGFYECTINYYINGDSIVDGESCYKLYMRMTELQTERLVSEGYLGLCLEKDRKVFQRKKTNPSGEWAWILLYDFNLKKGDSMIIDSSQKITVEGIDEISVKGRNFQRLTLREDYEYKGDSRSHTGYWVEGIGSSGGLLDPYGWTTSNSVKLLRCYENGECIFTKDDFQRKNGETDGIETTKNTSHHSVKGAFDLQGRRITGTPTRGIYVKEGKKYVVK